MNKRVLYPFFLAILLTNFSCSSAFLDTLNKIKPSSIIASSKISKPLPNLDNIHGAVIDEDTNKPIPEVKVYYSGNEKFTNSNGYFILDDVQKPEFTLYFQK